MEDELRLSASSPTGDLPDVLLDAPVAEGIEDLRARAAEVFLTAGGLITIIAAALPNYLDPGLWPRLFMLALGLPILGSALAVRRWGIPPRLVLAVAAAGDVAVLLATLVVARPADAMLNTASLGVLCVFVAVFGHARDLIGQTVLSNLVLIALASTAHPTAASVAMFLLWSNFGLILPSLAMYALRQRLIASTRFAHRLARTDPLTGTLNRRGLADQAEAVLRLALARDEGLGALACDLDHFKALNDTFGHPSGDEAITAVAGVLRRRVRAEDAVARLGGEEFAVVTSIPRSDLIALAERIRVDVAAVCIKWQLTISIGVSWQPAGEVAPGCAEKVVWALIDDADEWAYRAKAQGRNRVEYATAGEVGAQQVD